MIEVKIPKEIRVYKEKFLLNLTFRQTICTAMALIINVPLYIWLVGFIGADAAGWIVMIIAIPLALVGFIKYNGMYFEKFIWCVIRFMFMPQKRVYATENVYKYILEEIRREIVADDMDKKQKGKKKNRKEKEKAD